MRLEWLPVANDTRDAQLGYIAQDSIRAARDAAARIARQTGQLAQFPDLGRPGRQRGTRELVISRTSLVVVYRVRRKLDRIEILRVLHMSQQWPPVGKPLENGH